MKGRRFPSVAILVAMGTASTVAPKETDKAADSTVPSHRAGAADRRLRPPGVSDGAVDEGGVSGRLRVTADQDERREA